MFSFAVLLKLSVGGMKFGTFAVAKVLFPVSEKDGLRTTPHGPKRDVLCSQLVDSVTFNIGTELRCVAIIFN